MLPPAVAHCRARRGALVVLAHTDYAAVYSYGLTAGELPAWA
jgi:hypothetical protein